MVLVKDHRLSFGERFFFKSIIDFLAFFQATAFDTDPSVGVSRQISANR